MESIPRSHSGQTGVPLPLLRRSARRIRMIAGGRFPRPKAPVVPLIPAVEYSEVVGIGRAALARHSEELGAVGIGCLLLLQDRVSDTWENRERWTEPDAGWMAELLQASPAQVERALETLRRLKLIDDTGRPGAPSVFVLVDRRATRIDIRRLGYAGLSLLAALEYRLTLSCEPADPYLLSMALGIGLTCSQISEALDALQVFGYVDGSLLPCRNSDGDV